MNTSGSGGTGITRIHCSEMLLVFCPRRSAMVFLGMATGLRPSSLRPLRRKGRKGPPSLPDKDVIGCMEVLLQGTWPSGSRMAEPAPELAPGEVCRETGATRACYAREQDLEAKLTAVLRDVGRKT